MAKSLERAWGLPERIQSIEIGDDTRSVIVRAEPSTIDLDMLFLVEYACADTHAIDPRKTDVSAVDVLFLADGMKPLRKGDLGMSWLN